MLQRAKAMMTDKKAHSNQQQRKTENIEQKITTPPSQNKLDDYKPGNSQQQGGQNQMDKTEKTTNQVQTKTIETTSAILQQYQDAQIDAYLSKRMKEVTVHIIIFISLEYI